MPINKPFVPVNIPNAVKEPSAIEFNSWFFQANLYKEYVPIIPHNSFKKILEYDQKKDPSCVIFSACGMITYNTGLEFTYDEMREMWEEYQGSLGGNPFKTTTQMGQRFALSHFPVDTSSKEFEDLLDKEWAMQLTIWTDAQFFVDGVDNGIIEKIHTAPKFWEERYNHAIVIYRRLGRTFLQNSWKNGTTINIYDITDVYKEMIKNGLIRPCAMITIPYNQEQYPGLKITFKHYTRALARTGVTTITNLWEQYKKWPAKIDWKIDPEYRIR